MEYSVPQLIAMASGGIQYNPALAVSLNRLLRVRSREEYNVELKTATDIVNGFESQTVAARKNYGIGQLGCPLFQPMTIKAVEGQSDDLFLDSAVTSLSRTKNIVTTVIQGKDSSVKEFINNGDWSISVSGIICRLGWEYPMDDVIQFNAFMEAKQTISITHEVLNALGIFDAVVTDYTLDSTQHINCQAYSFQLISDIPLPLNIDRLPNRSSF